MSEWWVYIVRCGDGSLYTGTTTEVTRRVRQHQAGQGGAYTASHRPVRLVYAEAATTRSAAQRREARLKGWPRARKLAFVAARARHA